MEMEIRRDSYPNEFDGQISSVIPVHCTILRSASYISHVDLTWGSTQARQIHA
jgi:hypothetical protein